MFEQKRAETVLVAIDASNYSQEAFNWYMNRMRNQDDRLVLVHCIEMPSMPTRDTWENQTKQGKDQGDELQQKYSEPLKEAGLNFKFVMDFEKPGPFIVQTASHEGATVIVMGTRGMSKLRQTILGSVSNYVLNHADCPVLVCKTPKDNS